MNLTLSLNLRNFATIGLVLSPVGHPVRCTRSSSIPLLLSLSKMNFQYFYKNTLNTEKAYIKTVLVECSVFEDLVVFFQMNMPAICAVIYNLQY